MATYAIGDIQGCHLTFQALLERIRFRPNRDCLWLAGDLVNRGPDSLAVLRWASQHSRSVRAVLGNHDLWLLNTILGEGELRRGKDTFDDVLLSPDRDHCVAWLRSLPLAHRESKYLMVHGGLIPQWTEEDVLQLSAQFQQEMKEDAPGLLERIYSKIDRQWEKQSSKNRVATAANILTRVRACSMTGEVAFDFSGPPDQSPDGYYPWFLVPGRQTLASTVLFGHWSALGHQILPGVVSLDSGCVWGNALTAYCLETGKVSQQPSLDG